MIVIPGKIPIFIHPLFWFLAALIGLLYGGFSVLGLLWIPIVFLSVLIHEYGHALTARCFQQNPQISLVALGGLTTYEGKNLNFFKQFIIVLNGPVFGLLLFGFSWGVLSTGYFTNAYVVYFFTAMKIVNLFWSFVNLIPVIPLDGGQLLRIICEALFTNKGFRIAVAISMFFAVSIALVSLVFYKQLIFVAIIFFLFAFQNFELFRQTRFLTKSDQDDESRQEITLAEKALQEGNKEEAKKHFIKIREKKAEGLIFSAATQYLAIIEYEKGNKKEAYDLLCSVKNQLETDAKILLHQLSFDFENYPLVAELAQSCFQQHPCAEIALINARCFAHLKNGKAAGGWLQTASQYGKIDLAKILKETVFRDLEKDSMFRKFFPQEFHE